MFVRPSVNILDFLHYDMVDYWTSIFNPQMMIVDNDPHDLSVANISQFLLV